MCKDNNIFIVDMSVLLMINPIFAESSCKFNYKCYMHFQSPFIIFIYRSSHMLAPEGHIQDTS